MFIVVQLINLISPVLTFHDLVQQKILPFLQVRIPPDSLQVLLLRHQDFFISDISIRRHCGRPEICGRLSLTPEPLLELTWMEIFHQLPWIALAVHGDLRPRLLFNEDLENLVADQLEGRAVDSPPSGQSAPVVVLQYPYQLLHLVPRQLIKG